MNNLIYCFYPATYGGDVDGNALLYNVFNGTTWLGETQVPSTNTSGTPGSIAFDGLIWCFHEGNVNNGQLWYNLFDGVEWQGDTQIPSSPLSAGPSACVFQDKVYCFYSGSYGQDSDGNALLYNVYNGEYWIGETQVPLTNTSQAPSATVFRGQLYCFHQGNVNNGELWYNVFDGTNWLGDMQIPSSVLSSGPSACQYEGKLYCFYPGTYGGDVDGNALLYNVFDGTSWSGEVQVPSTNITSNPSVVTFEGKLYCFHQGNMSNGELWYNVFDGVSWSGDKQLQSSELSWGPGATTNLRNEVRNLLESEVIARQPPLPNPSSIKFVCPADSTFNWDNYIEQKGWGLTGIVNWQACNSLQGNLPIGSLFIFPGCNYTETEAAKQGISSYQGEAQINGAPATANYRLPVSNNYPGFTLHGQLCEMLMPSGTTLKEYAKFFLGFAYNKKDGVMDWRFRSGSLNGYYFYRLDDNGKEVPAGMPSDAWINSLTQALNEFFK